MSWGRIYSCEVVTMPKDHGRRLWCDNGTCRCQSISKLQNHCQCHWLHLHSSPFISNMFNCIILGFQVWIAMNGYVWIAMNGYVWMAMNGGSTMPPRRCQEWNRCAGDWDILSTHRGCESLTGSVQLVKVITTWSQHKQHEAELLLSRHGKLWKMWKVTQEISLRRHLLSDQIGRQGTSFSSSSSTPLSQRRRARSVMACTDFSAQSTTILYASNKVK